jgi:hypothetical protein
VGVPQTGLLRAEERRQAGGAWRRRGVAGHDRNTQQGGRTCRGDAPEVREGSSELLVRQSGRLGRRHRDPVLLPIGPDLGLWLLRLASWRATVAVVRRSAVVGRWTTVAISQRVGGERWLRVLGHAGAGGHDCTPARSTVAWIVYSSVANWWRGGY